jgi:hypothetical protein
MRRHVLSHGEDRVVGPQRHTLVCHHEPSAEKRVETPAKAAQELLRHVLCDHHRPFHTVKLDQDRF